MNKITIGAFLKVEPFIFNAIFIVLNSIYFFELGDFTLYILNTTLVYSPILIILALIRSKIAKFCIYHRLAIAAPLFGNTLIIINDLVYQFNVSLTIFLMTIIAFTTILTIFTGIKVFRRNERRNAKGTDKRLVRTTDKEVG